MSDLLSEARSVLAAQPFSVLLGTEVQTFGEGAVELSLAITDQLMQQHGFVHGGVISYLADNVLTFAGGSVLGTAVVTAEFKVNYLKPAQGDTLIARATVLHTGKTQAVCRCDVSARKQSTEMLCATALGTISRLGKPEG